MDDHNSIIEHIKTELTCAICLEIFEDPRTLSCLHSFCYECLSSYVSSGRTLCPLCQTRFNLPREGVSGLKKNHNIENILTVLKTKAKESKDQHQTRNNSDGNNNNNNTFPAPSAPPLEPRISTTTTSTTQASQPSSSTINTSTTTPSAPPLETPLSASSGSIFDAIGSILFTGDNPLSSLFTSLLPAREVVVQPPTGTRVLPFLIKPTDVPALLSTYLKSLWFLPSDFHESIVIGQPTAVFLPYWVFTIHTTARYKATIPAKDGGTPVGIDNALRQTHNNIICCGASESNPESLTLISDDHLRLAQTLSFGDAAFSISGINPPYPHPIIPSLTNQRIWAKIGQPRVKHIIETDIADNIRRQYNIEPNILTNYTVNIDYQIQNSDMVCLPIFFGEYTYNSTIYKFVIDARDVNVQCDRPYGAGFVGGLASAGVSAITSSISSWFS
eukprot:TRINITY_DN1770_c0_g1_i1.p1 TRINITY_DN1770_c0_g1~~TRINITY_DN1770_c0_g1_i1.p1  ORF type:complete len:445 (+),score=67.46 TRINITY_DN1770_c0_g1_i1:1230-2564(+)